MAKSRKFLGSLIVLGMVLSTFTTAALVIVTLPPKLIPHISLAPPENWWNSSWQYRKPITITNSGSPLTDYQMLFTVDTASLVPAGKMRSDAGDLRFATTTGTELPYWIESGANTSSTKVWVKVLSIPVGTTTIYMYYGNSSAMSTSNGTATFEFFDDFLTNTWTDTRGGWVATTFDGRTVLQSGAKPWNGSYTMNQETSKYVGDVGENWAVETYTYWHSPGGSYGRYWLVFFTDLGYENPNASGYAGLSCELYHGSTDEHRLARNKYPDTWDWPEAWAITTGAPNKNVWARQTLKKFGGNVSYTDAVAVSKTDPSPPTTFAYLNFHHNTEGAGAVGKLNVDWILVRKYVEQGPTYSLGSEAQSTSLSVSPSSFTEYSGQTQTLTATLTSGGSAVAGKTIAWSATSGSISPSSGTTNSSGQVTVAYTAPAVTDQTSVTVTTSFAGTASYGSSSGTSSGTIDPIEPGKTILSVSPPIFTLYPGYSGQVQSLTATLRKDDYNPLAGKTITWTATAGSISPSSGTTDPLGQAIVTYTAPTVTADTSVTITASFAGDAQYDVSMGTSSGAPAVPVSENIPASTGGTVIINVIEINITVNILVVPPNALPDDTNITVVEAPPENVAGHAMVSQIFDFGRDEVSFTLPSTLTLPYDENDLPESVTEDDLAVYRRAGPGKSWEKVVGNRRVDKAANTVSVSIDHLSEYAVMAQLPTVPSAAQIPIWVIFAAGLALVAVLVGAVWFHLREARGDTSSILIEHGLPQMRLTEVEVVREIRGMREFTITDLMQRTGAPNTLVWRTIQKLIEKGLVQPTEEVKPPAAGRGKPSTVYRYVGD